MTNHNHLSDVIPVDNFLASRLWSALCNVVGKCPIHGSYQRRMGWFRSRAGRRMRCVDAFEKLKVIVADHAAALSSPSTMVGIAVNSCAPLGSPGGAPCQLVLAPIQFTPPNLTLILDVRDISKERFRFEKYLT